LVALRATIVCKIGVFASASVLGNDDTKGNMKERLQERALAYLASHNVMTLATQGPDGIWAAAVFYVNEGFDLFFLSAPTTRHSINIKAHPRIAATIQEDYRDWPDIKGIQLEGEARQVDGHEKAAAIARYGLKFPIVGDLAKAPVTIVKAMSQVAWYKTTPKRVYFIDNSQGFGHRDEIPLE
jgi:uncharacterized protein YhbP (UPF0306 family)